MALPTSSAISPIASPSAHQPQPEASSSVQSSSKRTRPLKPLARPRSKVKKELPEWNPLAEPDHKPDQPRLTFREWGVSPEPRPVVKGEVQEEDVKPVINEATVEARLEAGDDEDEERKPELGDTPIPAHHPKAAFLRNLRRDPYPDHGRPPAAEYRAVCDALAVASDPSEGGTARSKWPAFWRDSTDDSVLDGLVTGMLAVKSDYNLAAMVVGSLPWVGDAESDDEEDETGDEVVPELVPEVPEDPIRAGQGAADGWAEATPDPADGDAVDAGIPRAPGLGLPSRPTDWRRIMAWPVDKLALRIRRVGGQNKKAEYVNLALHKIDRWQRSQQQFDQPLSLGFIRKETNDKCLQVYLSFKGVGPMTAMNEMGWTLGRNVMAVDG